MGNEKEPAIGTWNPEPGTWNLEPGTWNPEPGAIVLRFIFIFVGSALIHKFEWLLLVFGAFLVYSGIHMFLGRNSQKKAEIRNHWLVRFLSKHVNIYPDYIENKFWKRIEGKFYFTPLFIVLIMIEFTDLIFAMDSIPAIFSITTDPYIVFFSNVFAIIGLRSLFFLLARLVNLFRYRMPMQQRAWLPAANSLMPP